MRPSYHDPPASGNARRARTSAFHGSLSLVIFVLGCSARWRLCSENVASGFIQFPPGMAEELATEPTETAMEE
jgi:hypothetical protein